MTRPVWVWFVLALLLMSCGKPELKERDRTPTVAAPSVSNATSAAPAPVVAPRDLSVSALQSDLGCDKGGHPKVCRILKEFAQAQRFTAKTPSSEGRWIGPAIVVEHGAESARHVVLWCKSVPTSEVSPGDLPVKCGFEFIPDGLRLQSEKLMRALVRAADPPESNPAFQFAHAYVSKAPRTLAITAGPSVHITAEKSTYLRFVPPRRVFLVGLGGNDAAGGDGAYAELWLGDW